MFHRRSLRLLLCLLRPLTLAYCCVSRDTDHRRLRRATSDRTAGGKPATGHLLPSRRLHFIRPGRL